MRTTISAFQLGPRIGSGNFGTVHECNHPVQGRLAVKLLEKKANESDADWQQRKIDLLREGQRLKTAEHDRVVKVYDVVHDTAEDRIYLSLEWCRGSLGELYNSGPLDIASLRRYIADAAAGLSCVHSKDILHRDLKPGNILIGVDGRAKLADFGLVTDQLVLGYGSMAGYSDHIAYEVWQTKRTSRKSDIWGFGMTVYRLLLGKEFYESLPLPRHKVQAGGYADKLRWLPHIPKPWRSFVKKCMSDDPENRFPTAEAMQTAISRLPIEPNWSCSLTPDIRIWCRQKKNRQIILTHNIRSPRKHEWTALSTPANGHGRNRTLGGSAGVVSRATAEKGIETFLREN